MRLLISEGINVNIKSDASTALDIAKTPLDLAVQHQRKETVELLQKHGGKTGEELKAEGK